MGTRNLILIIMLLLLPIGNELIELDIRWPDGAVTRINQPEANMYLL